MALVDTAAGVESGGSVSSLSFSFTTTGNNRAICAGVGITTSTSPTISTITYNGVSLGAARAETTNAPYIRAAQFVLAAPAAGSNTLACTISAASTEWALGAVSATTVDQATPVRASSPVTASADNADPAVTVTASDANDLVVDVLAIVASAAATISTDDSRAIGWQHDQPTYGIEAMSYRAGGASVPMNWTIASGGSPEWAICALSLQHDSSGGPPTGPSKPQIQKMDSGEGYFPALLDVRNWISPRGGLVVQKWFTEELEPPAAGAASDIAAIGSLSITGVADLDALGSLLAAGTLSITGAADLDARGTLIAAGALSITGAADLDARGSLLAAGSLSISGAADLDAIGHLIAAGSIVINGLADLTSAATEDIAATGSLSISGIADLDATGSLLAAGLLQINGLAALTSGDENDLSAVGLLQITGSATLTSFGALIAAGSIVITGSADLTDGGVAPAPPPSFGGGGMGPLSPSISYRIDQRVKPKKAKERKREREKQVELEKPQPEVSTVVEAKPTFTIGDQIDAAQLERLRELAAELQRTRGLVVEIAGKVSDSEFDQALALLLLMSMD